MKTLKIDIVSDVVCPWCAVGYAHLLSALDNVSAEINATIEWHPFQLNPHMAKAGQAINEHLAEKYGLDASQLKENQQRLVEVGQQAGIDFKFDQRSRIVNTLDCHMLLDFAATQGKQTPLKLALFKAYFSEGLNVSDHNVLVDVAQSIGLEKESVENALADDVLRNKVKSEEDKYKSMGINSVPAFIINNQYLISGGQPVASFEQALKDISAKEDE